MNKNLLFLIKILLYIPKLVERFISIINISEKKNREKYIFYDKTNIFFSDAGTGIQRVANKVRNEIQNVSSDYRIVDVYSKKNKGYFYCDNGKKIRVQNGDIFLGVDCAFSTLHSNKFYLDVIYKKKVKIFFVLYDLIPLKFPEYAISKEFTKLFYQWLKDIVQFTGIIADSNAVLEELKNFLAEEKIQHNNHLKLDYVHLGSDITDTAIGMDVGREIENKDTPTFLMVSTVEPRKKYDQVIKAFNILWKKKVNVKLEIVGRPGWRNEDTIALLENNEYLNQYFFWYKSGISDEKLVELYKACDAVIFASLSEGFGLALVEAAYYKKPLIVRDIPVFREIAKDSAFYFDTLSEDVLAQKIIEWLELYKNDKAPVSNIEALTWNDCAQNIYNIITKE